MPPIVIPASHIERLRQREGRNRSFYRIESKCPRCYGTMELDVSYHGSAEWIDCPTCDGSGHVRRPPTDEEWALIEREQARQLEEPGK